MFLARKILTAVCAAMALLAGAFAALVALGGLVVYLVLRSLGRASRPRPPLRQPRPTPWTRPGDAIDVTATEVRAADPADEPARR